MNNELLAELVTTPEIPEPHTDDKTYRRLGILVLVALVGVFGVWAALAPLESAIPASGKVIVASNNRAIQHLEGGVIKSIQVHDGQEVKKGDILVVLDETQSASGLKALEAEYFNVMALNARLIAERDNLSTVHFPAQLQSGNGILYARDMDNQRREFTLRRSALRNEAIILDQRIDQLKRQAQGLTSTIKSREILLKTYDEEAEELEVLFKQQLVDKVRLREAKRQANATETEIQSARADLARIESQILEIQTQKLSSRETFLKEVLASISDSQSQISEFQARMSIAKDQLLRTKIVAPVDGTVANLSVHTVGGIINPSQHIVDIVPRGEPLIVEAKVLATDIANVHIGLKAEVQFPGFAHVKSLQEIQGEVESIGADAVQDEATHEFYYPAKIRITEQGAAELARNSLVIQPGIPAVVMIIVAKSTLADYLIHPIKQMMKKSLNEQ